VLAHQFFDLNLEVTVLRCGHAPWVARRDAALKPPPERLRPENLGDLIAVFRSWADGHAR
jgi:hypothetical protein